MSNEFSTEHRKTRKKSEFFPSLILNDSLFELKVIDLPVIPFFPADNLVEWSDYRYYGLRSASAYLLVYDVSVPSSFHFVKALRKQMYESRDMTNIPVIVAGNKMDLVASAKVQPSLSHMSSAASNNHHQQSCNSTDSRNMLVVNLGTSHHNGSSATAAMMAASAASMQQPTGITEVHLDRKEINHMVKKNWRSAHVECSAKYNWNVMSVFRELAITLDMIANGQMIGSNSGVRKKRCLVF